MHTTWSNSGISRLHGICISWIKSVANSSVQAFGYTSGDERQVRCEGGGSESALHPHQDRAAHERIQSNKLDNGG